MASFDSLVNGTQTLAMWTITVTGPVGSEPRDCDQPVGPPVGRHHGLRDGAGRRPGTAAARGWRSAARSSSGRR